MSEELAVAPAVQADKANDPAPVVKEDVKEQQPSAASKEGDEKPAKEPTKAEQIKFSMQKRIDRLTARNSEAERKLQELNSMIEKMKGGQIDQNAPKEDDFENLEDYLKAVGRYEAKTEFDKKTNEEKAKAMQQQQQALLAKKKQSFDAKEAEMRTRFSDYDEVSAIVNEYIGTTDTSTEGFQVFREVLMGMDNMPGVLYELGKNPESLDAMMSASPVDVARRLFRIEFALESAPQEEAKPKPKPPTASKGSAKPSGDLESMSVDELMKWAKR